MISIDDITILRGEGTSDDLETIHTCTVCGALYTGLRCPSKDHKNKVFIGRRLLKNPSKNLRRMVETECSFINGSSKWSFQEKLTNFLYQLSGTTSDPLTS